MNPDLMAQLAAMGIRPDQFVPGSAGEGLQIPTLDPNQSYAQLAKQMLGQLNPAARPYPASPAQTAGSVGAYPGAPPIPDHHLPVSTQALLSEFTRNHGPGRMGMGSYPVAVEPGARSRGGELPANFGSAAPAGLIRPQAVHFPSADAHALPPLPHASDPRNVLSPPPNARPGYDPDEGSSTLPSFCDRKGRGGVAAAKDLDYISFPNGREDFQSRSDFQSRPRDRAPEPNNQMVLSSAAQPPAAAYDRPMAGRGGAPTRGIERWSEVEVSNWVQKLGDSDAWMANGLMCRENRIDGLTLMNLTVEDLIDIGISKWHSKAIIAQVEKLMHSNQLVPATSGITQLASPGSVRAALMPLGPEEHNAMERLGDRVKALREAKVVAHEEVQKIRAHTEQAADEMRERFDKIVSAMRKLQDMAVNDIVSVGDNKLQSLKKQDRQFEEEIRACNEAKNTCMHAWSTIGDMELLRERRRMILEAVHRLEQRQVHMQPVAMLGEDAIALQFDTVTEVMTKDLAELEKLPPQQRRELMAKQASRSTPWRYREMGCDSNMSLINIEMNTDTMLRSSNIMHVYSAMNVASSSIEQYPPPEAADAAQQQDGCWYSSSSQNEWLVYDLARKCELNQVRLRSGFGRTAHYFPKSCRLEVGGSGDGPWTIVTEFGTKAPRSSYEWQAFRGFSTQSRFVRLFFMNNQLPGAMGVCAVHQVEFSSIITRAQQLYGNPKLLKSIEAGPSNAHVISAKYR